jgi:hypothetical protein
MSRASRRAKLTPSPRVGIADHCVRLFEEKREGTEAPSSIASPSSAGVEFAEDFQERVGLGFLGRVALGVEGGKLSLKR